MRALLHGAGWLLGLSAAGLVLLLGLTTSYAELARAVAAPNVALLGGLPRLALTPARWQALLGGLAAAVLAGALLAGLSRPRRSRAARPRRPAAPAKRRAWLGGPPGRGEVGVAAALLALLLGWRLYYALAYPLNLDELASYDYCVWPGAAVAASYYPYPNNHLLPNVLAAGLRALLPAGASPRLVLRLLPLLLSTALLPLAYAGLRRYLRPAWALLGLGLFSFSPLAVFYASAGRGYAWALAAALAGLAATLTLLDPAARRPARDRAWQAWLGSAALGLYAVPTHLYAVAALGLGLAVGLAGAPARRRRVQLARLLAAGAALGAVALVLYAPVLAVSGPAALLHNRYVAALPSAAEWARQAGPFLLTTAAELLGQRGPSAALYLALLLAAPLGLRGLRPWLPAATRRLGWLLYLQLGLWLPLTAAQGVLPPARTLLLVLLAFFLLLAVLGQGVAAWQWARRPPAAPGLAARLLPSGGWGLTVAAAAVLLYGGYRAAREQPVLRLRQQETRAWQAGYAWLRAPRPVAPGRIWVEPRAWAIAWHHLARAAGHPALPLLVVDDGVAQGLRPGATGRPEIEVLRAPPVPLRPGQPVRPAPGGLWVMPVSASQPLLVVP